MPLEPPPVVTRNRGSPVVRAIALLILTVALTAIYWIPFQLLWPIGAAFVLAILTILTANLASRHHRLKQRVDELEAAARVPRPAEPPQPEPSAQPPQK